MINYQLKKEVIRFSRKLYEKGFVANHDGNISVKLSRDTFLITPSAMSKGDLNESMLLTVDGSGKKNSGGGKPFSELKLHLKAYEMRAEISAVVHAHPPFATALSLMGRGIDMLPIAEAIVTLGDRVPLIPYSLPGSEDTEAFNSIYDVFILENHGLLAFGDSIERAYYRLELVEHIAKIISISGTSIKTLPDEDRAKLFEKHCKTFAKVAMEKENPLPEGELREIVRERLLKELNKRGN